MAVKVLIGKKAQLSKKEALNEGVGTIGSAFKVVWNELVGDVAPQDLGDNGLVTLGLSGNPGFKAALGAADGTRVMVYDIVRAYAAHTYKGYSLQSSRNDYITKTINDLWSLSHKTDSKSKQAYHNQIDYLASQNARRAPDSSVAATEAEAVETVEAEAETVATDPISTPPTPVSEPTGVVEPVEREAGEDETREEVRAGERMRAHIEEKYPEVWKELQAAESPEEEAAILKKHPEVAEAIKKFGFGDSFSRGDWKAEAGAEEEAEAEKDGKEETISEKECSELFDIEDPAIKKLLDKAEADNTIRGKVAEIGRDMSLSADAVTLSMVALTAAFPPAAAATVPVGAAVATTSVISSAVAVIFDLLNGEFKQAAFDAVGLIPFGGGVGKTAKAAGVKGAEKAAVKGAEKAAVKGAEKAAVKAAEKAAVKTGEKAVAKGVEAGASAGVRAVKKAVGSAAAKAAKLEAKLAETLVGVGVSKELADPLSKAIMVKAKVKIQEKLNNMLGSMPNPNDFDSDEEYKKAVSSHYKEQKKQSDKIFKTCFSGDEGTISKTIKSFLDWIHDWVDEVPRWLGDAVGWVIDTKDAIMGDDEEEAGGEEKESEKERQEKEGAFYESKSWREKKSLYLEHVENELIKRAIKNGRN